MIPIVHWRAFLHPQDEKQIGIEIRLANGETTAVPLSSGTEFTAVLTLLQSPNVQFEPGTGRIVAWK
jgi:hypothetical protein